MEHLKKKIDLISRSKSNLENWQKYSNFKRANYQALEVLDSREYHEVIDHLTAKLNI